MLSFLLSNAIVFGFSDHLLISVISLVEQQLRTEIEQLRTEKQDLLAKVKCHKDELTTANECKNAQYKYFTI